MVLFSRFALLITAGAAVIYGEKDHLNRPKWWNIADSALLSVL